MFQAIPWNFHPTPQLLPNMVIFAYMSQTMHSLHGFIFYSDPEPLGPDYIKHILHCQSHFSCSQKNRQENLEAFSSMRQTFSEKQLQQGQSSLALNADTASLTGSYTFTPAENLVLHLPMSKGTEQIDFALLETLAKKLSFWPCCFPHMSLPLILHLLWLHLHRKFNSLMSMQSDSVWLRN